MSGEQEPRDVRGSGGGREHPQLRAWRAASPERAVAVEYYWEQVEQTRELMRQDVRPRQGQGNRRLHGRRQGGEPRSG